MEEFFADKWAQVQLFMTSNSSNSTGVRDQQQSATASSPFPGCAATNSSSNNCEEETMSTTLSIYEQKLLEQFNQVHAFIWKLTAHRVILCTTKHFQDVADTVKTNGPFEYNIFVERQSWL